MKIIFGSDHAGLGLKQILTSHVSGRFEFHDVGAFSRESCDYPRVAQELTHLVLAESALGILICGSGIGMSIAANRVHGIRAALCANEHMARMSRRHNNANVLCLGERIIGPDLAKAVTDAFLEANFEGGRHQRRIDIIETLQP